MHRFLAFSLSDGGVQVALHTVGQILHVLGTGWSVLSIERFIALPRVGVEREIYDLLVANDTRLLFVSGK